MVDPNVALENITQVHFLHIFLEFWMDQSSIIKITLHQFQAMFFHLALTPLKDNYFVFVCTNPI
jgi:hypothetical protein